MKTYLARFNGRAKGAIGVFHPCETFIEAETEESARLKLYDTHEHITQLKIDLIRPQSLKRYRCTQCGFECEQVTNHYGNTWSWDRVNTCPDCPPHAKYAEFGGSTVWECLDIDPELVKAKP